MRLLGLLVVCLTLFLSSEVGGMPVPLIHDQTPSCVAVNKRTGRVALSAYRQAPEWLVKQRLKGGVRSSAAISSDERACVDWIMNLMQPDGVWWQPNNGAGDPNVNRLVLMPLLDYFFILSESGLGGDLFATYKERLSKAVSFQYQAYHASVPWDGAAAAVGKYVNQDIYYALIMQISGRLLSSNLYRDEGDAILSSVGQNLLPDGGFHYIGQENESPVYHAFNQVMLARYYQITSDPKALALLKASAGYWALTMSQEGFAEAWSDVWWKQSWMPMPVSALNISAAVSGNGVLAGIARELSLTYSPYVDSYAYLDAYADQWKIKKKVEPTVLPKRFLVKDENIRGVRARYDDWYFGFTQGRGLRNTFVGGLISAKGSARPETAFRGAQIDVKRKDSVRHGLWLSQSNDKTAMVFGSKEAALAVAYTLQSSRINDSPLVETPDSPWRVTQIWAATENALIGAVTLVAEKDDTNIAVEGRFPLGPCAIVKRATNDWSCGRLMIRFYSTFSDSFNVATMPSEHPSAANDWQGLSFRKNYDEVAAKDVFKYVVWIGPAGVAPPKAINFNDSENVLSASWKSGRKLVIKYDDLANNVFISK